MSCPFGRWWIRSPTASNLALAARRGSDTVTRYSRRARTSSRTLDYAAGGKDRSFLETIPGFELIAQFAPIAGFGSVVTCSFDHAEAFSLGNIAESDRICCEPWRSDPAFAECSASCPQVSTHGLRRLPRESEGRTDSCSPRHRCIAP